jgi:formiminotetrahydrofolate cyclodeaminase
VENERYLDLRLQDFLDRVAAGAEAPGAGTAAAVTVALGASLVAMVARCSEETWEDARGITAQALAIQDRVGPLANADASAWEVALDALGRAATGDPVGDAELERRLEAAAQVPLDIAQLGADVAELAVLAAERCDGSYRADAVAAAALAAGAARAAAHLVEVNLGVREGDQRLARARASEQAAADAAERVLASIR